MMALACQVIPMLGTASLTREMTQGGPGPAPEKGSAGDGGLKRVTSQAWPRVGAWFQGGGFKSVASGVCA